MFIDDSRVADQGLLFHMFYFFGVQRRHYGRGAGAGGGIGELQDRKDTLGTNQP